MDWLSSLLVSWPPSCWLVGGVAYLAAGAVFAHLVAEPWRNGSEFCPRRPLSRPAIVLLALFWPPLLLLLAAMLLAEEDIERDS